MRTPLLIGAGAYALAVLVAAPAAAAGSRNISATVTDPGSGSRAVTYDPAAVPTGAQLTVKITQSTDAAAVALDVAGLLPDHDYAAHAHVRPCGTTGADAGPHFQHTPDPAAGPDRPSTDPAYANPQNEVRLDLRTDADGAGHAETEVPFTFTADRSPRSVVVHEAESTATDAGSAGARVACLTLPAS